MFPNLLTATQEYWKKLDELEKAYQRGEVSLEEVDCRVSELMAELGEERRAALSFLSGNLSRLLRQQEVVAGVFLAILTYAWVVVS